MSAVRGAGVGRSGLVMKVTASAAALANAAAQIQLIWAKLDRSCETPPDEHSATWQPDVGQEVHASAGQYPGQCFRGRDGAAAPRS